MGITSGPKTGTENIRDRTSVDQQCSYLYTVVLALNWVPDSFYHGDKGIPLGKLRCSYRGGGRPFSRLPEVDQVRGKFGDSLGKHYMKWISTYSTKTRPPEPNSKKTSDYNYLWENLTAETLT